MHCVENLYRLLGSINTGLEFRLLVLNILIAVCHSNYCGEYIYFCFHSFGGQFVITKYVVLVSVKYEVYYF